MATERTKKKTTKVKKKRLEDKTDEQAELIEEKNAKSVRSHTKAKFDHLLQQALNENNEEQKSGKKKKKKPRSQTADSLIESMNADISKDEQDDKSRLANTFDPDDFPKSTKSNKRRQRLQDGLENSAYESDLIKNSDPSKNQKKSPKKSPKKESNDTDKTMTLSELTTSPPAAPQRKRKKKKTTPPVDELDQPDGKKTNEGEMRISENEEKEEVKEDTSAKTTTKKTRRKKQQHEDLSQGEPPAVERNVPPDIEDQGEVLCITIHGTDKLKTDFNISHPMVRVQVIDTDTGTHLQKQHVERAVTSYYEPTNASSYILPIMTQPFDFKKRKSTVPAWEELLLFNENFNLFTQEKPRVILFFEVLDFVTMNTAKQKHPSNKDSVWHQVSWAFLKLVGPNGSANTDKKLRLQLFYPQTTPRSSTSTLDVFEWWTDIRQRRNYPSTLYVTVKGLVPPEDVEPSQRSMFATQREEGRLTYGDLEKTLEMGEKIDSSEDKNRTPSSWTRLPGQVCKVPNSLSMTLSAGRQGCFVLKFSNDGKQLACACHDKGSYPVLIYEIPSGKLKGQLTGHYSIIYDLSWSKTDREILTASADCTTRLWKSKKFNSSEDKILPHPSFVYTAQFHPRVNSVIATGGYDRVIRIWTTNIEGNHAQLIQELEGHSGYINSLCFDQDGQKMYSADSVGTVMVWNSYVTEKPTRKGVLRDWSLNKEVVDEEYKGVPINLIRMHPKGRRVLIHCRDNTIRMIDLRVHSVMQRYIGALNFREQIRSTVSPCGTFVVSGSEDMSAYVWNTETGDQVAMYTELNYKHPVCDVDFHPQEHMIAFCSFRDNQPILIYTYDHKVAQQDAGLDAPKAALRTFKSGMDTTIKTTAKATSQSLQKTSTLTKMDFDIHQTARREQIMTKLGAVSAFRDSGTSSYRPSSPDKQFSGTSTFGPGLSSSMLNTGGWGSTFDQTSLMTQRNMSPVPAAFSPHATGSMDRTKQQQQFQSHNKYYQDSPGGWRPSFGSIGRQGSMKGRSPNHQPVYGRPPLISLNSREGKPQFTFQGNTRRQQQVVALYDYGAQRSDELTISRGDIITVLYKDNDNWWMGQLTDGEQGFFPANYVASKDKINDSDEDLEEDDQMKPKKTTAVVSKTGELKFISETDDSEVETPKRKERRRRKGSRDNLDATEHHRLTRTPSIRSLNDSNA